MNDHGYTLPEALAALLMLGLALGGLTEAVHAVTQASARARIDNRRLQPYAAARRALASLPHNLGPFRSPGSNIGERLKGSDLAMTFACGAHGWCSVQLLPEGTGQSVRIGMDGRVREFGLRGESDARFAYVSAFDGAAFADWPSPRAGDRLGDLVIHSGAAVLAVHHLEAAQNPVCPFDIGVGDCISPARTSPGP
jgi:hypothetical protein